MEVGQGPNWGISAKEKKKDYSCKYATVISKRALTTPYKEKKTCTHTQDSELPS
jgi:hypothetical protein